MKMYRHLIACAALVLSMAAVGVRAEQSETKSSDTAMVTQGKKRVPKLEKLSMELSLTDEQKLHVASLLGEEKAQIKVVSKDTSLTDDVKKARKKEISAEYKTKVRGVLTPEQQEKYDKVGSRKKAPKDRN
jgi:Spy/CpxP family protein refolding chaperone